MVKGLALSARTRQLASQAPKKERWCSRDDPCRCFASLVPTSWTDGRSGRREGDNAQEAPHRAGQAVVACGSGPGRARSPGQRGAKRAAPLVAGGVPDRGGLLLHPGLHSGYRGACSRGALAHRHSLHSALDPLRSTADVQASRRGEPARPGLYLDAREVTLVLARQGAGALPLGLRGYGVAGHDHPLGGGRSRPRGREPANALLLARPGGARHAGAPGGAWCDLPQGLRGGHRHRHLHSRGLPPLEPPRRGRRLLRDCDAPTERGPLAGCAVHELRQPPVDAGGLAPRVSATSTRAIGLRDRRGMMPLVRGDPDDAPERPAGRIRNTRRMLTVAALIMSFYLITTSVVTTLLIPEQELAP